jgi:ribosomal protection tetracycline resistance protein
MIQRVINIGVMAHVDAGKTSLSERLLFENGAITKLGSVDTGSTTTDSNELERERGITIRSAVAAFLLGDLQVNLVDTPGHPDFIAEVERALAVLDGAVLVISAVEGVQAQTKVLMRSLLNANVPTLLFINKVDRMGARPDWLLDDIRRKLVPSIVQMNHVLAPGGPDAKVIPHSLDDSEPRRRAVETLAEHDLDLLAKVIDERPVSPDEFFASLVRLTAQCKVFPVFNGSALVGTGARDLAEGVRTILPSHESRPSPGPARGVVFAIERLASGEKIAYLRLNAGELRERDEIKFTQSDHNGRVRELTGKVTGLNIVGETLPGARPVGVHQRTRVLTAGNIGKVRGMTGVRVGAQVGLPETAVVRKHFPPPTLQSVVRPKRHGREQELHEALVLLSDEDPLIRASVTADGAASVLLYGEVQKEVIAERLIREFGVEAEFSTTSPIYIERPIGIGYAVHEIDPIRHNDFWATIGIRLIPHEIGKGNRFVREVPWGQMPPGFYRAIEESAMETLEEGLHGWCVTDCSVHLVKLGYDRPVSVAADFRNLTPILVMRALQQAGTMVYEPCQSFELEVPDDTLGDVMTFLSTHEAEIGKTEQAGPATWVISGEMPARVVQDVAIALPGLTHGEALLTAYPGADRPLRGEAPRRSRTDGNPLNYEEYMRYLSESGLSR